MKKIFLAVCLWFRLRRVTSEPLSKYNPIIKKI